MNFISSSQNQVIKEVKSLKEKKHREAKGMFFIEGIRFVEEAVKEGIQINKILVSEQLVNASGGKELLERISIKGYDVFTLPHKLFKEVSDTESPQGVLAVLHTRNYSLMEVYDDNNFFVILDSVQDPGNMGTIIRTADAAGATAVVVSRGCVDVYNPKVLRSTMGSLFHVPICYCEDTIETLKELRVRGVRLYAAHLEGKFNYFDLSFKNNIAVIIGNEANGISDEVKDFADILVRIPMIGKAESLNASVAAGILMYEVLRNRMQGQ
ncbi:MAG: TrmH family RNA methyltransferase [Bacillota bacterium]